MVLLDTIGDGSFTIGGAFFTSGGAFYIGIVTFGGTRASRPFLRRTVIESSKLLKSADVTGFFQTKIQYTT